MRERRRIGDHRDANAGGLNGADGRFAALTSTLHAHLALVHALGKRRAGRILRNHRRRERRGLAAALESSLAGRNLTRQ